MLGDEYISQHVLQAYGDWLEQTSYKVYMSDLARVIAKANGADSEMSWREILDEINGSAAPEKQTENEEEIKSRLLAKLNGREGA